MAHARLTVAVWALCLALVPTAHAVGPCGEDGGVDGLRLEVRDGALVVLEVKPDTAGAATGLVAGDRLLQVNATVPHACAEFVRAVREARSGRMALLFLVRRDDAERTLAMSAATWGPPATAPAPSVASRPSFPEPAPPVLDLPDDPSVTETSIRVDLERLAGSVDAPGSLTVYRKTLSQLRRAIATVAQRRETKEEATNALRAALRPFEAAEVAWDAVEGEREREGRMRHVPVADEATRPYFEASPVAAAIEEFPFLRSAVVREPTSGMIESAGAWRPLTARALLWQHGHEKVQRLAGAH